MHPVAIIFGFACFGSLAVTASQDRMTRGMSLMMAILFCVANLLWLYDRMDALPLFDLPIAMASYAILCINPNMMRFVTAVAFAFRLTLHLPGQWGIIPLDLYLHWINAAFLAALVAISWEGGRSAIVGTFSRVSNLVRMVSRASENHPMAAKKR